MHAEPMQPIPYRVKEGAFCWEIFSLCCSHWGKKEKAAVHRVGSTPNTELKLGSSCMIKISVNLTIIQSLRGKSGLRLRGLANFPLNTVVKLSRVMGLPPL